MFANKDKQESSSFMYPVPIEHCFYKERYVSFENSKNGKSNLLNLDKYISTFNTLKYVSFGQSYALNTMYRNTITGLNTFKNKFKNYIEVEQFFASALLELETLENAISVNRIAMENIKTIKDGISRQKELIEAYKAQYGSDDNDIERREKYIQIVTSPEVLYSVTC